MVLNSVFLVFLAIVVITLLFLIYRHLSRFPRCAMDVAAFLRGGDLKHMMIVVNPVSDAGLEAGLTPHGFKAVQRRSLYYVLDFLSCWRHDARVFLEWSCEVIRRETIERPGEPDAHLFVKSAQRVQHAAVDSRLFAMMAMLKIRFWLVFRTQWWLPLRPPQVATLANVCGRNFFETYNSFLLAVGELGELHGPEFKPAFLQSLMRPDPLDVSNLIFSSENRTE